MRITSKFGAVLASSALAGSMMVGGAAVAQAQGSLPGGSLESLMPAADVGLTVATDDEAVGGVLANNTAVSLDCEVGAAEADLVEEVQALVDADMSLEDALAEAEFSDGNSDTVEVTADTEDESDWTADGIEVGDDFVAGAYADCGEDLDPVFVYESSGGLLGSLDFGGSLQS